MSFIIHIVRFQVSLSSGIETVQISEQMKKMVKWHENNVLNPVSKIYCCVGNINYIYINKQFE